MLARVALFLFFLGACSTSTATTTPPSAPPAPTTSTTLDAADVYARVSPALAFVETPTASGSAVLVDPTTLVTNAHVVWPAVAATVTFPNGVGGAARVIGYDWMTDLALLDVGGLEGLPAPATLESAAQGPGATVYLVGYPADDRGTASPAITAGIVSRTRTWPEVGVTFIQSDALISGGQSGGALVDRRGQVVGISGLSVGDGFALALTTPDLLERLESIRTSSDPDGLGDRSIAGLSGPTGGRSLVPHLLDETVFVFQGATGDSVSIEIEASAALNADLVGPDGFVEASNAEPDARVVLEAELVLDGPYFVVVYPELVPLDVVTVTGVDTRLWKDPDHGRRLELGAARAGNGDYPGDLDWFVLDLTAGQTVTLSASSINIDASLLVDLLDPGDASAFVSDSDSGGGVLGYDSVLEFTAPQTASYAVAVFDETGFGPGGYMVSVKAGRR